MDKGTDYDLIRLLRVSLALMFLIASIIFERIIIFIAILFVGMICVLVGATDRGDDSWTKLFSILL
jgi:hypothetical protein